MIEAFVPRPRFGLPTDQAVVDIDDAKVRTELFDVAEAGTEDTDENT